MSASQPFRPRRLPAATSPSLLALGAGGAGRARAWRSRSAAWRSTARRSCARSSSGDVRNRSRDRARAAAAARAGRIRRGRPARARRRADAGAACAIRSPIPTSSAFRAGPRWARWRRCSPAPRQWSRRRRSAARWPRRSSCSALARTGAERAPWTHDAASAHRSRRRRRLGRGDRVAADARARCAGEGHAVLADRRPGGTTAGHAGARRAGRRARGVVRLRARSNVLARGEDVAAALGVAVARTTLVLCALAAFATAAAVTTAGSVGFVGLVVPHASAPCDRQRSAPAAAGMRARRAARCLLLADTLARTIAAPIQLPVGVITALVGVPVFLRLLARGARDGGRPRLSCRGLCADGRRPHALSPVSISTCARANAGPSSGRTAPARRRSSLRSPGSRAPAAGEIAYDGKPLAATRPARARDGSAASCRRTASTISPPPCSRPRSSAGIRISRAGNGNRPPTSRGCARALAAVRARRARRARCAHAFRRRAAAPRARGARGAGSGLLLLDEPSSHLDLGQQIAALDAADGACARRRQGGRHGAARPASRVALCGSRDRARRRTQRSPGRRSDVLSDATLSAFGTGSSPWAKARPDLRAAELFAPD